MCQFLKAAMDAQVLSEINNHFVQPVTGDPAYDTVLNELYSKRFLDEDRVFERTPPSVVKRIRSAKHTSVVRTLSTEPKRRVTSDTNWSGGFISKPEPAASTIPLRYITVSPFAAVSARFLSLLSPMLCFEKLFQVFLGDTSLEAFSSGRFRQCTKTAPYTFFWIGHARC